MDLLSGHLLQQVLYESVQSRIYQGVRLLDGLPVIIKLLNQPYRSAERRARFEQEYRLMQRLHIDAVPAVYNLEREQGRLAIVMEDFGGISLNRLDLAGKLAVDEWLRLAVHITQRLGQLHARQVMHKDINPSNIVWNRETNQLKLIDLGIATELAHEVAEARPPDWLEGTLAYISPEQTGRMNRSVDYRTDFYSLGATLYELLTGQPPFMADDALKLVHAHIAKAPVPAHEHKPDVPAMVSAILARLLVKTAEERYQSASGLVVDLRTCLQTLDEGGRIPVFALGQRDFSLRLQIPQKLYGREHEVRTLLTVFDRTARGNAELLLVAGHAGVGKSALVHEVHKPITGRRSYFIEGKFDQFQRDIPYRALVQAFSRLIRQLLTAQQAVIEEWKDRLLQALSGNAQVIIDVIPELELLLGKQPAVLELPPEQARNRFNLEFRQFVAALATAEHPLAIFIDDLQWADLPSLDLLALLLRPPALPHLLLIGAYRENEVAAGHALAMTLDGLQKQGAAMCTIALSPLGMEDVKRLLADTLHVDAARTHELAQLCLAKTGGNPFFLNQFLMTLDERGMLRPNAASGSWHWDIERIRDANITDNVVELMVAKLRKLSEATQRVLQGAACLGNVFDLKALALICGLPQADAAHLLWPALAEELIIPLDAHYKHAGQEIEDDGSRPTPHYRFLHDRVLQAASLLSSEADRAAMHLTIGRLWLETFSPQEQGERLFDLVNHLNQGRSLIDAPPERGRLVELNLAAGRKAKASGAYKPALAYLQIALELASDAEWQRRYDLMFELHLEAAETAYLAIDYEQMQRYIDIGLGHARDVTDQVKLHEIHILSCISQKKSREALLKGLEVLRLLGVSFPKRPTRLHSWLALMKTRVALRGKSVEQLERLPDMTDRRILAASSILHRLQLAAYYTAPLYHPLFVCQAVQWGLRYGYGPIAASYYASYGMVLNAVAGEIAQGARYIELAAALQSRPKMKGYQCRTIVGTEYLVKPWHGPLHATLAPFLHAYALGVELGDLDYSAIAAYSYCMISFHCGHELGRLEETIPAYCLPVEQTRRISDVAIMKVVQEGIHTLREGSHGAGSLFDPAGSARDWQQQLEKLGVSPDNLTLVAISSCMKLIVHYLLRQHEAALENAVLAEKYASSNRGSYNLSLINFYGSLARLALYGKNPMTTPRATLRMVKRNQKQMQRWAKYAPANFLHKWHLVEAELARISGRASSAIDHFEHAMALAKENDFPQEAALAQELAGQFYLSSGHETAARLHLREALQSYRRWGALAKARDMESRYPEWLREPVHEQATVSVDMSIAQTSTIDLLGCTTAMEAMQVMSQETVFEELLKRFMNAALEHAGAQSGALLLNEAGCWRLHARKSPSEHQAVALQPIALDEAGPDVLPLSLLRYVERTGEAVMIHDAAGSELTAGDPYVLRRAPRSLLMAPLQQKSTLMGVLYLENNAASGAFNAERLQVLQLLTAQAAISIKNARLVADMERQLAELRAMPLPSGSPGNGKASGAVGSPQHRSPEEQEERPN